MQSLLCPVFSNSSWFSSKTIWQVEKGTAGLEAIIMELHTMAVVTMVAMEVLNSIFVKIIIIIQLPSQEVGKAGIMVEVMVGAGVMLLPKD